MRIVPWPSRTQRKAVVAAAQGEAEQSRRHAAEAAAIEEDLRRMTADNHFAEMLQAAITGRPLANGRGSNA